MGHERWFRGQHDGQSRPFDWLAAARQQGIPQDLARALHERAMQQAHGSTQSRVQEIYLALLADARRDTPRPSPGKVTRTMRLQAQRAGKKLPVSNVSPSTSQPIEPCKVSLTSYVDPGHRPAHGRRNETRVSEELQRMARTAPQAFSEPEETRADEAMRRYEVSLAVAIGDLDALAVDDRELLASGYGIAVNEPRIDEADEAPTAQPLPEATRQSMERAFGQRFNDVTVHLDSPEVTGDMHAFTRGREIHFRTGAFAPGTRRGDHIIAHELAHIVQQSGAQPASVQARRDGRSTGALEVAADRAATQALLGQQAAVQLRSSFGQVQAYRDARHGGSELPEEKQDEATALLTMDTWMDMAFRGLAALEQASASAGAIADDAPPIPEASGGRPMPAEVQAKMEHAFDADFSAVRIHEGRHAEALGALAYTRGTNIHFAPGEYQPESSSGQALLGHELAHMVQQSQGRVSATMQWQGVGINDDAALEREADAMGAQAARGQHVGQVGENGGTRDATSPSNRASPGGSSHGRTLPNRAISAQRATPGAAIQPKIRVGRGSILSEKSSETKIEKFLDEYAEDNTDKREFLEQKIGEEDTHDLRDVLEEWRKVEEGNALVAQRITQWTNGDRETKRTTAPIKRVRLFNHLKQNQATELMPVLLWAHTAPIKADQPGEERLGVENDLHQGKDAPPQSVSRLSYFRGQENRQTEILNGSMDKAELTRMGVNPKRKIYFPLPRLPTNFHLHRGRKEQGCKRKRDQMEPIFKHGRGAGVANLNYHSQSMHIGSYDPQRNSYSREQYIKENDIFTPDAMEREAKRVKLTDLENPHGRTYYQTSQETLRGLIRGRLQDQALSPTFHDGHQTMILDHYRGIVHKLAAKQGYKKFSIVAQPEPEQKDSQYKTYPGIIVELSDQVKQTTTNVEFRDSILKEFNELSTVKMFERNSMGFLYPTISILDRSVRIWPGQLDVEIFLEHLGATLDSVDEKLVDAEEASDEEEGGSEEESDDVDEEDGSMEEESDDGDEEDGGMEEESDDGDEEDGGTEEESQRDRHAMLLSTLDRAVAYVRSLYREEQQENALTFWLHQRIITNLEKAKHLKQLQPDERGTEQFYLETTQVIENLMEYGFYITEHLEHPADAEQVHEVAEETYGACIPEGYELKNAILAHSGMQAGNIAKSLVAATGKDATGRLHEHHVYFEFPNTSHSAFRGTKGNTEHCDPAFNFTHRDVVERAREAPEINESNPVNVIIDMTNLKPSEIKPILERYSDAKVFYVYGSLTKHFQLGMDKFTLGILLQIVGPEANVDENLPDTQVHPTLNSFYCLMQGVQNQRRGGE